MKFCFHWQEREKINGIGYTSEREKELYFANVVIGAIKNVETPMLMFKEEKNVVEKALRMYIDKIEEESRR